MSLEDLRLVYSALGEIYGVSTPFSQLQRDVENEALMETRTESDAELHLALSETPCLRNDEDETRDANVHSEVQDSGRMKETDVPELQNDTQQVSEEEVRDTDVHAQPQNNTQQDSDRGKKDTVVSGQQHRPVRSRYAGMTVSRLVVEDDSQASEDETQEDVTAPDEESTQIIIISPDKPSPRTRSNRYDNEHC